MWASKLLVSDKAYDQFMKLLKKFRKDQVEAVVDKIDFFQLNKYH